jgi:hypothetical protein
MALIATVGAAKCGVKLVLKNALTARAWPSSFAQRVKIAIEGICAVKHLAVEVAICLLK